MYFIKNYLKNNRYYPAKHSLKVRKFFLILGSSLQLRDKLVDALRSQATINLLKT